MNPERFVYLIECPDCGVGEAHNNRCPKCGGDSWVPRGGHLHLVRPTTDDNEVLLSAWLRRMGVE